MTLTERPITSEDAQGARLFYAANDDAAEDARAAAVGHAVGALVNVVDTLEASQFLTPAIVDRDPVTIAIGTEGAAPVLARRIKALNEDALPAGIGQLAAIGRAFRGAAEALPHGRPRREFWSRYYDDVGPRSLREGGEAAVKNALEALLCETAEAPAAQGRVSLIGAGPGDPELLTLKARRILHDADVVIHDRLVSNDVLELARREAVFVEVGKTPGGHSWSQDAINAVMVEHAAQGAHVARLKSGDPAIYGRLDEEMDALDTAGVAFEIIPGVTSAAAAAAEVKVSLTRRNRNSSFRFLTGHDVDGFAEHDWRALAQPGAAAAIYMGVRAARFLQGRLTLHGAAPGTPVTVVENASRANQKILGATLSNLPQALNEAEITGPAILFFGLAPREAWARLNAPATPLAEAL